jgi:hypothetical protein
MICPVKICKLEIPDDSLFCDQCGTQLLRCPKCGNIGTGICCTKCGTKLEPIAAQVTYKPTPPDPLPPKPSIPEAPPPPEGGTTIVNLPSEHVYLCHPEGWKLELSSGDVLGRTSGPHASRLGLFPVISSNHARISKEGDQWFITDLKSTNKTYVNGTKLEPNVPAKIKQNDVVILANITFTVREA